MKVAVKKSWLLPVVISVIALVLYRMNASRFAAVQTEKLQVSKEQTASFYYTCPMHPQVHSDKPGECPICHMKLVQVKGTSHADPSQSTSAISPVQAMESQLKLLAVQKVRVEKMDLTIEIPISARFISATSVAFQIYESDLFLIRTGLRFELTSPSNPAEPISGKIQGIDSIVDPSSRTVRVVGSIDRSQKSIPSEATATGVIKIKRESRIAIPSEAVLHTGRESLVYLINDQNKLTPKAIKLGEKTESYYEVLEGLKEGDEISSGANFLIDSESKILGAGNDRSDH